MTPTAGTASGPVCLLAQRRAAPPASLHKRPLNHVPHDAVDHAVEDVHALMVVVLVVAAVAVMVIMVVAIVGVRMVVMAAVMTVVMVLVVMVLSDHVPAVRRWVRAWHKG